MLAIESKLSTLIDSMGHRFIFGKDVWIMLLCLMAIAKHIVRLMAAESTEDKISLIEWKRN